ncbi:MAG: transitional endoplasmic reticulum ATPase [Frankiaceae bacterium]|jgi:transitional endoplasmic reticulum ATPase|nr:transitional endoplasmic reticulum ATPase [Frankiaceae bacterium]
MAQRSEVALYHRHAAVLTSVRVLHDVEKQAEVDAVPRLKRKKAREQLDATWEADEQRAATAASVLVRQLRDAATTLDDALATLSSVGRPELLGKVEAERLGVQRARAELETAATALEQRDFGTAGASADTAMRDLLVVGVPLVGTINELLAKAAVGREARQELETNLAERRRAKVALESQRSAGPEAVVNAAAEVHRLEATSFELAAGILGAQVTPAKRTRAAKTTDGTRVVPPQECETFADVGGLDDVKDRLRATVGAILDDPGRAAKYRVVHNGILFHGPPGTGKTLLSRALAGEYGLRYLRFSPASIASSYIHEAAANLQRLFELARQNVPCLLFLDEVDTIAADRGDQPSADHREVVTQLMNSLEEFRTVPGLVIVAATNDIDRLDPGLREGRFDSKILVPLPDTGARADVVRVLLQRRTDAVDWDGIDVDEVARRTGGRNAAALEAFVSVAAQSALAAHRLITQDDLLDAVRQREGGDRTRLDDPLTWDDVVLDDEVREQLDELLAVFVQPDLARKLGVSAPAGILLHGPPGTGKTTVAKVIASEVAASFYEMSAADLLSKWAGESEQRVAKLFTKARSNRPAVIFVDEIDGLLRRRTSDGSAPWEQRVVGQFLRELDGLRGGDGVLLVGATNRLDIIDEAIVGRRLTPIEIGLPDAAGRARLLAVLCRDMTLAKDVHLAEIAAATEGMSGADLRRVRDAAGMKALTRTARSRGKTSDPSVKMADFDLVLASQRGRASLIQI